MRFRDPPGAAMPLLVGVLIAALMVHCDDGGGGSGGDVQDADDTLADLLEDAWPDQFDVEDSVQTDVEDSVQTDVEDSVQTDVEDSVQTDVEDSVQADIDDLDQESDGDTSVQTGRTLRASLVPSGTSTGPSGRTLRGQISPGVRPATSQSSRFTLHHMIPSDQ